MIGQGSVRLPEAAEAGLAATPAGRPLEIALKQTAGVHDVFFVFRNPAATAIQPLMTLSSITLLY